MIEYIFAYGFLIIWLLCGILIFIIEYFIGSKLNYCKKCKKYYYPKEKTIKEHNEHSKNLNKESQE